MDQVVAAAGSGKKELTDKYISSQLMKLLGERTATTFPGQEKASVKIVSEQEGDYLWEVIHPIICEGDVIGGVILLSRDEKRSLPERSRRWQAVRTDFLGRQMEQ